MRTRYHFRGRLGRGKRRRPGYNEHMFFRRERPKNPTFAERMESLRKAGLTVTSRPDGTMRVSRENCAVDIKEDNGSARVGRAGILMGDEIGALVDGGFQKFFRTLAGLQKPALADELQALHDFEEDLAEALGQPTYYNQSLGTTSTYHPYDRLQDRDHGVPKRVWE